MPDINDIHRFYERNIPGYERRDIHRINRFFLELMGRPYKKPLVQIGIFWKEYKVLVWRDWFGWPEPGQMPVEISPQDRTYQFIAEGRVCDCGSHMVKRRNRAKGNYFLGCSSYPRCTNTRRIED